MSQELTPSKQDHPDQIIPSFHIHPYDSPLNNNICSSAVKSSRTRSRAQCCLWVGAGQRREPGAGSRSRSGGRSQRRHSHTEKHTTSFGQCPLFHCKIFVFCFLLQFSTILSNTELDKSCSLFMFLHCATLEIPVTVKTSQGHAKHSAIQNNHEKVFQTQCVVLNYNKSLIWDHCGPAVTKKWI